jgi:hypothetical protein
MNKYNLYVREYGSCSVFAEYFETNEGSFYFYTNEPEGENKNTLVSVYPVANTVIFSIEYDINKK